MKRSIFLIPNAEDSTVRPDISLRGVPSTVNVIFINIVNVAIMSGAVAVTTIV